jgi:AcrR family transcriptional regulator
MLQSMQVSWPTGRREGVEPPGLRERKKLATRERLTAAALARFTRDGFAETTVGAIAGDAGVSPRTFFHYFDTKEDVLLGDFVGRLARLLGDVQAQPPETPVLQALWHAVQALADSFDADPGALLRWRLVVTEPSVNARALELQSAWEHDIVDVLAPRCPGPDPVAEAHVVAAVALAVLRTSARASATTGAPLRPILDASFASLRTAVTDLHPR